jgi:protein-disulfide isomerase/uncharacterized membrane protein
VFEMIIIFVLAILGILDTGYLSYIHLFGGQACGQWTGCSFVLSSPYTRILGVPLSTLGLGVYSCFVFLALYARATQKKADAARWIFYISLTGNLFAGYLIYLQAAVIQHWCPFCLLSAALILSIFITNFWHNATSKDLASLLKNPNWRLVPKFMLGLLILPSVIFLGMERTIEATSIDSIMPESKTVAHIGERTITLGEVDHAVRGKLKQIEWERYEARLKWLENELFSMEAARQNLSVRQLMRKKVDDVITVSEEEIQKVYNANKSKLSDMPLESVRDKIVTYLEAGKWELQSEKYYDQLKQDYNVSFLLPKPAPLVLDENPRQGPEMGEDKAAITVIVFTDFECPFCSRAHQQIKDLFARYPQDVRVLFRHFPLDMHKDARTAAYAAACAHLQGKFWPYADLLFENQGQLDISKLYGYAEQVGLDMDKFKECMESGQGEKMVEADIAEGLELGINGTPGVFINGHFFNGVPTEKQVQLILDKYLPEKSEG